MKPDAHHPAFSRSPSSPTASLKETIRKAVSSAEFLFTDLSLSVTKASHVKFQSLRQN
jgi:hypothetical protein